MLGLRCDVGFSLVVRSRELVFSAMCWLLTAVASLVMGHRPVAQAQELWHTGLVALQHVGSSQSRDRTRVPCIGRRDLTHTATREVLTAVYCVSTLSFFNDTASF